MLKVKKDGIILEKTALVFENEGVLNPAAIREGAFVHLFYRAVKEFANSLKNTLVNLEISSKEFSKFTTSMNNGKGMLSKLINDEKLGVKLDSTMSNLQSGTKGLSENMEAAKQNFLLKGYFNKKKKAEAKKQQELKKKNNSKK